LFQLLLPGMVIAHMELDRGSACGSCTCGESRFEITEKTGRSGAVGAGRCRLKSNPQIRVAMLAMYVPRRRGQGRGWPRGI
jgi:hypothetical protein